MKRVLVQAGHLAPREPGHQSQTGAPGEAELVAKIRQVLVRLLRADGRFQPIPVPGDIPDGIRVDAAVFLHADGAADPRASGFCFGYPPFQVNKRLASLIAGELGRIPGHPRRRADNYTADLAGYYGFSKTAASGGECVVEHGFVTNPREREWLFAHVREIGRAEYVALCRYFGFAPKPLVEEVEDVSPPVSEEPEDVAAPPAPPEEPVSVGAGVDEGIGLTEADDDDVIAVEEIPPLPEMMDDDEAVEGGGAPESPSPEFDSTIGLSRFLNPLDSDPAEIEAEEESTTPVH